MRYRIVLSVVLGVVAVTAFTTGRGGWRANPSESGPGTYVYMPAPPVRTYPSSQATIQRWIDADDSVRIRRHAWDIWESITHSTLFNQPIWQTWYSGYELFEDSTNETRAKARGVHGLVQFERRVIPRGRRAPRLPRSPDGIPFDLAERTFAFNRFTQSAAQFIWKNRLNQGNTLRDTLNALVANGTPIASQQVLTSPDSTDASQFVIKTVFQFVSGTELTAVPYWAGDDTTFVYDTLNPVPSRWRQAVALDPLNKYKSGDSVLMVVNNEPPRKLRVAHLDEFYSIKITPADSVHFSHFGPINGDFIGVANDTSAQAVYMAMRPGNIGLLMAMHVTGKEIPNWTWQSFWWANNPNNTYYGHDRPVSIKTPWNHYNMTAGYAMTHANGSRLIAFNPYLETSLEGKIPDTVATRSDSLSWTGVITNCMACHRRAAIGWGGNADTLGTTPPYGPAMFVKAGDSVVFTQPVNGVRVPVLKTDFLWSVAIRGSAPTGTANARVRKR